MYKGYDYITLFVDLYQKAVVHISDGKDSQTVMFKEVHMTIGFGFGVIGCICFCISTTICKFRHGHYNSSK
jgi:hypothetical protein